MSKIWNEIEQLVQDYLEVNLNESVIDYEKYYLYSIVTSSTRLEGSTLDETDTRILLDEGLTAKGKPLEHHLMVKNNYSAILFAMEEAAKQRLLSPEFLRQCNALNMADTGIVRETATGRVDGRKGEYRRTSAHSEALGYYAEYSKIPAAVEQYCKEYNRQIEQNRSVREHLTTGFDAHANLILIHPWMDGNKRTSRLVMNFIQKRANLPLCKVHLEDIREYLNALKEAKDTDNLDKFRLFMAEQYAKTIRKELSEYKKQSRRGFSLIL